MFQLEPYRMVTFVPNPPKKKPLTREQHSECALLKSIFESKKKYLGYTQESIGLRMNMNQSSVGHYLNGRNALNLDVATKFANLLGVDIEEFSPRLKKEALAVASAASVDQKNLSLPLLNVEQSHNVMVHSFAQIISKNKGQGSEMYYAGKMSPNTAFLRVETDQMQGLNGLYAPKHSVLRIEQHEPPMPGDTVVYNLDGSPAIGEYSLIAGKPHVRPSNPQYPLIDVSHAQLLGVVYQVITDAKQKN